eukprot:1160396-Pelagomonas_calceolata.AAC.17
MTASSTVLHVGSWYQGSVAASFLPRSPKLGKMHCSGHATVDHRFLGCWPLAPRGRLPGIREVEPPTAQCFDLLRQSTQPHLRMSALPWK